MLLYAITSRILLAENEPERAERLAVQAASWSAAAVDYIQLRENDLPAAALTKLAGRLVRAARAGGDRTRVLINAEPEAATRIARESGADGIHLRGGLSPAHLAAAIAQIRQTWPQDRTPRRHESGAPPPISVSCHSVAEVEAARAARASLALFAPVFEKILPAATGLPLRTLAGHGLETLARACRAARQPAPHPELPVFALGGVTAENTPQCLAAGAAGIAAIRLFLNQDRDRDWRRLDENPG